MTLITTLLLASVAASPDIPSPRVHDDRLQVELFAAEPDIVTPVGLAVDDRGRVFVIESHTHFRPQGYKGPKHDRIRLFEDRNDDGKADRITTFYEGLTHTMNIAFAHDGSLYVATRAEIFRLRDTDDDGQADERTPILRLDTPGNYPHNGLSGFAFDLQGNVYFGFGENLGAAYKLIGSDGKTLSGGGEGGNVFRCRLDGSGLTQVATGFWNPFHVSLDRFGRLLTVDNDPDSRPPCRLIHVVPGGDYGFQYRHGRKGTHAFTSWNGELPGKLPMVTGTGEAPCAVLPYESDGLPAEYRGRLLVTSWGDHRLEQYPLMQRGASYVSTMKPLVTGGENFRPVGLDIAPDGSLFMSDWVDRSYKLHGKGRIWRLSQKSDTRPTRPANPLFSPHCRTAQREAIRLAAAGKTGAETLAKTYSQGSDAGVRALALQGLARAGAHHQLLARAAKSDESINLRQLAAALLPKGHAASERVNLFETPGCRN